MSFFLFGCRDKSPPPSSNYVDRSMTDYAFVDISENCNIHHNINISDINSTGNETVCTGSRKEFFMYYSEENNWSIMCCEFTSKCNEEYEISENLENLCADNDGSGYSGYIYNDNGFWLAQCCSSSGGSCYVDTSVDVDNDSTVCDEKYHQNSYSVDFNGSYWSAMCCIGGIEE